MEKPTFRTHDIGIPLKCTNRMTAWCIFRRWRPFPQNAVSRSAVLAPARARAMAQAPADADGILRVIGVGRGCENGEAQGLLTFASLLAAAALAEFQDFCRRETET